MTARSLRSAIPAATLACVVALSLSSCSRTAGQIDYAVDATFVTYNTNTVVGAASGGPQAFARVLTGFNYHGPDGQVVGDRDFGSISVVGRTPLVLDYQINDQAVYSDGKPVTCDDMVLAWAAQSGRYPAFDAASQAGYRDIAGVDCAPGAKRARVSFAQDRPVVDYGQLFAATSIMPSHVIADELGLGDGAVATALQADDGPTIDRIAKAWNTIWTLTPDVDLKRFPSSGPYKLDQVTSDGAVVLVANDKWWGPKPVTASVKVWPLAADIQDRLEQRAFDVVDVATGSSGTLNVPDDYVRSDSPSAGIEQLIFAAQGPLADPVVRRAVALCTPRDVIAQSAGVPIADSRLNTASEEAITAAETDAEGDAFTTPNDDGARDAINGRQIAIRIGYQAPNSRLAATVGAIAKSCAAAGIAVTDAADDGSGPQALRDNKIDALIASYGGASGSGSTGSSTMDAYAFHSGNGNNLPGYVNERIDGVIDAMAVTSDAKELARLLAEGSPVLWGDMPTLPLYRQQRTLLTSKKMSAVSSNPTRWGAGWNMDRWVLKA
jgi:peptide/nickel transport system substrate-binding protein